MMIDTNVDSRITDEFKDYIKSVNNLSDFRTSEMEQRASEVTELKKEIENRSADEFFISASGNAPISRTFFCHKFHDIKTENLKCHSMLKI